MADAAAQDDKLNGRNMDLIILQGNWQMLQHKTNRMKAALTHHLRKATSPLTGQELTPNRSVAAAAAPHLKTLATGTINYRQLALRPYRILLALRWKVGLFLPRDDARPVQFSRMVHAC